MARTLQPKLIAFPFKLTKGAFVILPGAEPDPKNPKAPASPLGPTRVLRFQYNPETITRTRTGAWDVRKNQKADATGKGGASKAEQTMLNSLRGGGLFSKAETIAMKIVFDATEVILRGEDANALKYGVLPELGALEGMALAEAPKDPDKATKPKKGADDPVKLNAIHPKELLLVLGERYFPVIVTSMTITEKRFSAELVPLRAEVDLQMQILEATEVVGNPALFAAYKELVATRKARAMEATSVGSGVDSLVSGEGIAHDVIAKALVQDPTEAALPQLDENRT